MADKYSLHLNGKLVDGHGFYDLYNDKTEMVIARVHCLEIIAIWLDNALNQTSRAGSKTSQAKRDASKKNIAKRWSKE